MNNGGRKVKEKLIMLLFGAFVSLATLYISDAREKIEPLTIATSQEEKVVIYQEVPEPEQEKSFYPVEEIPLDAEMQEWIYNYCLDKKISPALVLAIIEKESSFESGAVGDGGEAIGLMQIQVRWHTERMEKLGITDLEDAKQNIQVGVDYLAELFQLNPEAEWVLNAYNGGRAYADRMEEKNIQTDYSNWILNRAAEIERLVEK